MRDSKQREVVLNVIESSFDHPSAETVLLRCKNIMPTINLATVYRNLNALAEDNKILRIHTDKGDRFDHTLNHHAHFKCECCGKFTDIYGVDVSKIINNSFAGVSKINKLDFIVSGVCDKCNNMVNN